MNGNGVMLASQISHLTATGEIGPAHFRIIVFRKRAISKGPVAILDVRTITQSVLLTGLKKRGRERGGEGGREKCYHMTENEVSSCPHPTRGHFLFHWNNSLQCLIMHVMVSIFLCGHSHLQIKTLGNLSRKCQRHKLRMYIIIIKLAASHCRYVCNWRTKASLGPSSVRVLTHSE